MSVQLTAAEFMGSSLGSFVYHLVLLLTLLAALGIALGEWRHSRYERPRRLVLAVAGLFVLRLSYVASSLLTWTGWISPVALLPPLERLTDVASLCLLGWAFAPVERREGRLWDLLFGVNLVAVVAAGGLFLAPWQRALADNPTLAYSAFWQSTVWSAWHRGLTLLAGLAVVRSRGRQMGLLLVALSLLLLGNLLQIVIPPGASHWMVWIRWANLVAYPLLLVAVYQGMVEGLRTQVEQLRGVGQASMDQVKSLLQLFDASRRVVGSLSLPMVLDNAVQGIARALDADQCAIALVDEVDATCVRLPAVHNPSRQAKGEPGGNGEGLARRALREMPPRAAYAGPRGTSRAAPAPPPFPLDYQMAIQQAMRRKKYVTVEDPDNVQLRVLFALLGSNESGPLLVQPLLIDGEAIGAILVGNAQSRRPFTPHEAKLCQAMADHVAVAIQNARRYQAAEARIHELHALMKTGGPAGAIREPPARELADRPAGEVREPPLPGEGEVEPAPAEGRLEG